MPEASAGYGAGHVSKCTQVVARLSVQSNRLNNTTMHDRVAHALLYYQGETIMREGIQ